MLTILRWGNKMIFRIAECELQLSFETNGFGPVLHELAGRGGTSQTILLNPGFSYADFCLHCSLDDKIFRYHSPKSPFKIRVFSYFS